MGGGREKWRLGTAVGGDPLRVGGGGRQEGGNPEFKVGKNSLSLSVPAR